MAGRACHACLCDRKLVLFLILCDHSGNDCDDSNADDRDQCDDSCAYARFFRIRCGGAFGLSDIAVRVRHVGLPGILRCIRCRFVIAVSGPRCLRIIRAACSLRFFVKHLILFGAGHNKFFIFDGFHRDIHRLYTSLIAVDDHGIHPSGNG